MLRFVVFYKELLKNFTNFCLKPFSSDFLAAEDYGLRKRKILSVSNIIVLRWQNICFFKPKIYCNINQKLAKQFTLHWAEAYKEPFQASKQGSYLFGGNYFRKNLHLRCFTRFWIRYFSVNHKNNQTHKAKTHNMATLRQGT